MKKAQCLRAISLLAAVTLLFTACHPSRKGAVKLDPKNPVSLEIWHYYNGPQKNAFDELVAEFNDTVGLERGIIVDAYSQGNVNELTENVIAAAEKRVGTGEIPDVFAAYADTAFQVDQMGLVADLDPYLSEAELEEYIPEYLQEGRLDKEGHLKIFPIAKSTEVTMVNLTDFNKFAGATGASLDDLKTVEGITATAKKYYEWTDSLTPQPNDGKAFFGHDAIANYFVIGLRQLGFEVFSVKDGEVTVNADRDALKKLWDNLYVPYLNGYFAHYGRFRSDDAKTGDLIALVCSTSGAAYFPSSVTLNDTESYPIEAAVLPCPVFEGGAPYAVQQGAGMVVTKSDAKTEYAATVFLKWFTEAQRNIEFSVGSGYLPVKSEANDAGLILSALQKMEDNAITRNLSKTLPVAIEMTKDDILYTSMAFEGGTDAREILEHSMIDKAKADRAAVQELLAGGMSLEEAVSDYLTDENFESWYRAFVDELNKTVSR